MQPRSSQDRNCTADGSGPGHGICCATTVLTGPKLHKGLLTIAAISLLLTTACQPIGEGTTSTLPFPHPTTGPDDSTVTWIDDGDTIEVATPDGDIEVRLIGINAPDRGECQAQESLDHLIDTLKGRKVRIEEHGTDQFGRVLGVVFEGERNINLELVQLGLAIATTPGDQGLGNVYVLAENEAFNARVGLWSAEACNGGPVPRIEIDTNSSNVDPRGPDDEQLGSEIIVISNRDNTTVDLSGWILRDESSRHRYEFVAGTQLDPGDSIAISSDDPKWDPGGSSVWNNGGDMALLQDSNGAVIARWRY